MNTLYVRDGLPIYFSADQDLTQEAARQLAERLSQWNGLGVMVLPAKTEIRHLGELEPLHFGQQVSGESEPRGWPTALVVGVGLAYGLIGFVFGGMIL